VCLAEAQVAALPSARSRLGASGCASITTSGSSRSSSRSTAMVQPLR
jgi:hypothetical protein